MRCGEQGTIRQRCPLRRPRDVMKEVRTPLSWDETEGWMTVVVDGETGARPMKIEVMYTPGMKSVGLGYTSHSVDSEMEMTVIHVVRRQTTMMLGGSDE
jgi:hypothetical protein